MRHAQRTGGRLIRFHGYEHTLVDEISCDALLERTGIEHVLGIDAPVEARSTLVIHGYVRPVLQAGVTTLLVTPLADGSFRPFEIAKPHQCCGGH